MPSFFFFWALWGRNICPKKKTAETTAIQLPDIGIYQPCLTHLLPKPCFLNNHIRLASCWLPLPIGENWKNRLNRQTYLNISSQNPLHPYENKYASIHGFHFLNCYNLWHCIITGDKNILLSLTCPSVHNNQPNNNRKTHALAANSLLCQSIQNAWYNHPYISSLRQDYLCQDNKG